LAAIPLKANRVSQETVAVLDELLVRTLHQLSMYEVIGRNDIVAMLALEQQKEILAGCDDESCFADIGAALGAQFMVTGSVSQLGDELIINLTLLDAFEKKALQRVTTRIKSDENLYLDAIVKTVHDFVSVSLSSDEWERCLVYRNVSVRYSPP
jgi:hypothetical protein